MHASMLSHNFLKKRVRRKILLFYQEKVIHISIRCLFQRYVHMVISELFIAVEVLLYAPTRPIIDFSVGFLWLMSVGTVICASLWSDITARDKFDERYNDLSPKVFPFNLTSVLKFMICTCCKIIYIPM